MQSDVTKLFGRGLAHVVVRETAAHFGLPRRLTEETRMNPLAPIGAPIADSGGAIWEVEVECDADGTDVKPIRVLRRGTEQLDPRPLD